MSVLRQRLITIGVVGLAAVALGLGAAYQGERDINAPAVIGGGGLAVANAEPAVGADDDSGTDQSADATDAATPANPIEGFFPMAGTGGGCTEPVGVDLAPGFGATLTINGVEIAPEAMNVVRNADGTVSNQLTAGRSLGHYTYGPEENCPHGSVLRPTDNVLQACVYRLVDGPDICEVSEHHFDAL